jgi:hypothetical protein
MRFKFFELQDDGSFTLNEGGPGSGRRKGGGKKGEGFSSKKVSKKVVDDALKFARFNKDPNKGWVRG